LIGVKKAYTLDNKVIKEVLMELINPNYHTMKR